MATWFQDCYSSNILQVGYDSEAQEMLVTFRKNRQTYAYPGVTEEKALQLANAPSVGSMFHTEFKTAPFRKL